MPSFDDDEPSRILWQCGSLLGSYFCTDPNEAPKSNGSLFARDHADEMSIEQIKTRWPSQAAREIESLLAALQIAMATEVNWAKQEILKPLGEMEDSLDIMVRKLARKISDANETRDGSNPR